MAETELFQEIMAAEAVVGLMPLVVTVLATLLLAKLVAMVKLAQHHQFLAAP
jgi:hypothetical protein